MCSACPGVQWQVAKNANEVVVGKMRRPAAEPVPGRRRVSPVTVHDLPRRYIGSNRKPLGAGEMLTSDDFDAFEYPGPGGEAAAQKAKTNLQTIGSSRHVADRPLTQPRALQPGLPSWRRRTWSSVRATK